MSHISTNKTTITQVHEGLLQETVELLAQAEPGIKVEVHTKDYGMRNVNCDLAIYTPNLPRGIGLNWKNKEGLEFIGDGYGAEREYERVQKLLLITYQALAVQKCLTLMGYSMETQQPNPNLVRVEALHA